MDKPSTSTSGARQCDSRDTLYERGLSGALRANNSDLREIDIDLHAVDTIQSGSSKKDYSNASLLSGMEAVDEVKHMSPAL